MRIDVVSTTDTRIGEYGSKLLRVNRSAGKHVLDCPKSGAQKVVLYVDSRNAGEKLARGNVLSRAVRVCLLSQYQHTYTYDSVENLLPCSFIRRICLAENCANTKCRCKDS